MLRLPSDAAFDSHKVITTFGVVARALTRFARQPHNPVVPVNEIEVIPEPATPVARVAVCPSWVYYAALVLVIAATVMIRLHLRNFPLERDEGEYAYAGQLMLQGIPPYKLAYNMKLPGTYAAYAAIMAVFGQTPSGIHDGLLILNVLTIWFVFLLGARLFGRLAGVTAAASYALLAMSPSVEGFAGHASHFVVFFAVAGMLLLLKAERAAKASLLFASGLLFGLAFLMKQPGILFAVFAALYLFLTEALNAVKAHRSFRWKAMAESQGILGLGVTLPFLLTCLLLWRAGVFRAFWFWTFTYARQYVGIADMPAGWLHFKTYVPVAIGPSWPLWALAGVGLSAPWWNTKIRAQAIFLFPLLLCSFLAVCPGLYFREHYFVLMLPALAILVGAAVESVTQKLPSGMARMAPMGVFVALCLLTLAPQWNFLLRMPIDSACRAVYGFNPFPEAIPIAEYIKSHSAPGSTLAVLGSEPEIYFYSGRHSATGFIYTYELMEAQPYASQMQRDMVREIEASRPEFIVIVYVTTSWLAHPESDRFILDWSTSYAHAHYQLVGIADILPQTQYRWGADVRGYQRRSTFGVEIYKKVR